MGAVYASGSAHGSCSAILSDDVGNDGGHQHLRLQPEQSASCNGPLGLAPVKNNSPAGVFWYKPDSCATTPCPIKECKPGETCNVDGLYPPNCKSNPIKIVDGCTGTIDAKGKLKVICSAVGKAAGILKGVGSDGYGQVDDEFMKNHPDWPKPNLGPGCVKKTACN